MPRTVQAWVLGTVLVSASPATALPGVGVEADIGVPDGGTAALVVRPIDLLRVSAGVSHNGIGPGVRGSVTVVPLSTWFTPTLSVSYGRYFERDATAAARTVSGDATLSSPALERVGYDYADAHLGFELGQRHVTFFLHAGLTRISGHVRNLGQLGTGADPGPVSVTFTHDPTVVATTLSARFGLIVYIL